MAASVTRDDRVMAWAMGGAACMIAHQVAGKAARDGFFLMYFSPADLPKMVVTAALLSIGLAILSGKALQRVGPRRLIPVTFAVSSILHVAEWIAMSRAEIDQARLLVLRTAWLMDKHGNKAARKGVSLIKVVVPRMQTTIANRAIQTFGAKGLTNDTPVAFIWSWGRALQIVDGLDEVHLRTISRIEVKAQKERLGNRRLDELTGFPVA